MKGTVTVYTPNGEPHRQFHADGIGHVYTGHPPVVAFVEGDTPLQSQNRQEILQTILPFIMEEEDYAPNMYDLTPDHTPYATVSLLALTGNVVRLIQCSRFDNIATMFRFVDEKGKAILTSFPFLLEKYPVEDRK